MNEMYMVTLVDAMGDKFHGIHNDKDEAALAALAEHTRQRAIHAWNRGEVTALPMLKTFEGYDAVALYWEDVHGGSIGFQYKVAGPYDTGELDVAKRG